MEARTRSETSSCGLWVTAGWVDPQPRTLVANPDGTTAICWRRTYLPASPALPAGRRRTLERVGGQLGVWTPGSGPNVTPPRAHDDVLTCGARDAGCLGRCWGPGLYCPHATASAEGISSALLLPRERNSEDLAGRRRRERARTCALHMHGSRGLGPARSAARGCKRSTDVPNDACFGPEAKSRNSTEADLSILVEHPHVIGMFRLVSRGLIGIGLSPEDTGIRVRSRAGATVEEDRTVCCATAGCPARRVQGRQQPREAQPRVGAAGCRGHPARGGCSAAPRWTRRSRPRVLPLRG